MTRYFELEDEATTKNLTGLDYLSRQRCDDGDLQLFDTLLHGALQRLELLPPCVGKHFHKSAFYVGDFSHFASKAGRKARWRELAGLLDRGLDSVAADVSLRPGGGADFKDRKATRGERIEEACINLTQVLDRGLAWESQLAHLEREAGGTSAGSDVRELRRLLTRKRFPDWSAHKQKVTDLLFHARLCAHNLHHLP